jgi:alkylation response protein AidB-like acyl-CoA dehydrogenase
MSYIAPVKDMLFNIEHLARIDQIAQIPGFEDAGLETAQAVLEECAKLNESVIAPLNWEGDKYPSSFHDGKVTTTPGFKEAYRQYTEGGWQGLQHPAEFGGQGLPKIIGAACGEILQAANMSFALCPLLTDGAIEALLTAGSDDLKAIYLEKLISGHWTGTMNLTEPQAGSDLGALQTRAVREDGHYRIQGQKIYITYGEHDMADNIVHMVLARTPDAPAGSKGISLFIVPKFLVNPDGSLGQRNDLRCVSIEHKLGIKASPTCVLAFGDGGGAKGWLVGQENRGLEYMFTMMNVERLGVGIQGLGLADRALQQAIAYAKERRQSRALGSSALQPVAIIEHADVRRNLGTMRALVEAGRALAYAVGGRGRPLDARDRPRGARRGRRPGRGADPGGQVLAFGHGLPGRLDQRAGARRHGLHRGDRRGAALPRRPHPADLRGHQRHPGQRSGGPQDGARWRADRQGDRVTDRGHRGRTDAQWQWRRRSRGQAAARGAPGLP